MNVIIKQHVVIIIYRVWISNQLKKLLEMSWSEDDNDWDVKIDLDFKWD